MKNISLYSTGNEFISLDNIIKEDISIKNFTVLHMASKGLLDFRGGQDSLLKVNILADGLKINFDKIKWELIDYWIPKAIIETETELIEIIILTPLNTKGFAYNVNIHNKSNKTRNYEVKYIGSLDSLYHCVNEEKLFRGYYETIHSTWNNGPVFSISNGFPVITYAPIIDKEVNWEYTSALPIKYNSSSFLQVNSNKNESITCYIGVGYEEVSAVATAIEMNRVGFENLLKEMENYLSNIVYQTENNKFNDLLNMNLFYTLFYSTGKTIDTEERVIVTSRSPKYYVSAAYWDRDSLLWAFPAIVEADCIVAKEIIEYISTIQAKNIGIHSRFIDGTILEPGFELDELCSFIIALDYYLIKTNDLEILLDQNVKNLIDKILMILETKKSDKLGLYETFLQPTDDMRVYPYLTYNNVLVSYCFKILDKYHYEYHDYNFKLLSKDVDNSIFRNCVKKVNNNLQFIWSIDENGDFDIYDEPPGSLILLPLFDFISKEDKLYINTTNSILDESYEYSFKDKPFGAIGCPHAPHPWVLSLANNLRVFHDKDSLNKLINAEMDNGIACESIDEYSGECTTGEAFATCAGYLSYSLIGELDNLS